MSTIDIFQKFIEVIKTVFQLVMKNMNIDVLKLFVICYGVIFLLFIVSYFMGFQIIQKNIFKSKTERIIFLIPIGLGILATLVFIVGSLGYFDPKIIYIIVAILLIVNYRRLKQFIINIPQVFNRVSFSAKKSYILILIVSLLFSILLLPMIMLSLYPETAWDSTMYHLVYSKSYIENHQIAPVDNIRHPVFSQLFEIIYTLVIYFSKNVIAAKILHFIMQIFCAIIIYSFCKRFYSKKVGFWSSLLWLTTPLVVYVSVTAYIDIALTVFVTLAIYALVNWIHTNERLWLVISAILLGFSCSIKYTGIVFVLICGVIILIHSFKNKSYHGLFTYSSIIFISILPWYLYNYLYTNNPMFPFYQNIFGYYDWSKEEFDQFNYAVNHNYGMGKGLKELFLLPWNLTFKFNNFFGEAELSFVLLMGLPFLLIAIFKDKLARLLLIITVAYMGFWFINSQVLRYIIPILPILSVAIMASINRYLFSRHNSFRAILITSVLLGLPGWIFAMNEVSKKGEIPTEKSEIDNYLTTFVYPYPAVEWLNKEKGKNYNLYTLYAENMFFYADGYMLGEWQGKGRYSNIVSKLQDSRALYSELTNLGMNYFLYTTHRVSSEVNRDDYFKQHFKIVFARPHIYLYELTDNSVKLSYGQEIIKNKSFEEIKDNLISDWTKENDPYINTVADFVSNGKTSLNIDNKNVMYQVIPIEDKVAMPGQYLEIGKTYRIGLKAKTFHNDQNLRIQISWINADGKFAYAEIDDKLIDTEWNEYESYITIPDIKGNAVLYFRTTDGNAFIDDISLKEIIYDKL